MKPLRHQIYLPTHIEPGRSLININFKVLFVSTRPISSCDSHMEAEDEGWQWVRGARGPISSQSGAYNRRLGMRALCRHDNSTMCGTRRRGDGGGEVTDGVHLFLVCEHGLDSRKCY